MKLRGNKLKPLRFDSSGACLEDLGISQGALVQQATQLLAIRDSLVLSATSENLDPDFYDAPKRLLLEYEKDRHGSLLANLFRVANRMHASVDRVVVIGVNGVHSGARTFLDGCCQPYWNELSRGARGSKPRIYFDGNNLDNDATQGLLSLLGATEGRPSTSELDAWGLVVVGNKSEMPAALEPFMRALDKSCSGDVSKVRQRLIAITDAEGALRQRVDEMGCENVFPYPEQGQKERGIGFTCFSPIGLVPAALMGVNVIEVLLGAVATNKHFEQAKPDSNCILQYVAVNRLLAEIRGVRNRVLSIQNHSLESLGGWYQHLLDSAASDRLLPCRVTHRSKFIEGDSRQLPFREDGGAMLLSLFHHLIVEEPRFDPIGTSRVVLSSNLADESDLEPIIERQVSQATFPELLGLAFEKETQLRRRLGVPSTNLFIPKLDELHLGQLLQMLMISTMIELRIGRSQADKSDVYGDVKYR